MTHATRRRFLQSASAGLGVQIAGCAAEAPVRGASSEVGGGLYPGGLKAAAASRGFRFGSAVGWAPAGTPSGSFGYGPYAALMARECALMVPENELKWQVIHEKPGQLDFARYDAMASWASGQRLLQRGHTLLWHKDRWMPNWVATHDLGPRPASAAADIVVRHIAGVCAHTRAAMTSYDVVNETVVAETGALEQTRLSQAIGAPHEILDLAFHTAREHAPGVQLVYNDYMSWEPGNEAHRDGVLRLLEGFRARNVPVDALGIQSHLAIFQIEAGTGRPARQEAAWRRFLDEVTAMGYRLAITEFDVRDDALPTDPAVRDAAVARFARDYLDITLSYPQLRDILVWGLCDRFSWLTSFLGPRPDGTLKRGCVFDAQMKPKPLYHALAAAMAQAPMRAG